VSLLKIGLVRVCNEPIGHEKLCFKKLCVGAYSPHSFPGLKSTDIPPFQFLEPIASQIEYIS